MRRAARQRLFLLLGVAVLVALAAWQWQRDAAAAPGALTGLDPAAVSRVTLTLQGSATEHYAKRDGHWWRTDGTPARADDGRLDELTEIAAAPVASWRPLGDFDPARIGLAKPMATLVLDDQTLRFGDILATGPLRYVQAGERVALVSLRYTPRPARRDAMTAH
ncbi:MAG TPA: hypothetical protein VFW82_13820 [Dyella sp.]|nr:hypothetical protein [Dyella sp.]